MTTSFAIESVGYLSAIILNTSAVPQIIKTYKTKSANDLSWGFFGALISGLALNVTYGALIRHPAIYLGSTVSLGLYGSIAAMKYRYTPKNDVTITEQDRAPILLNPLSSRA
jgi:MtN3 and saliva related transmembrane protein